jgi:hypothetical protein
MGPEIARVTIDVGMGKNEWYLTGGKTLVE